MKVILAGSTGFIGGEVLEQCLRNPSVTSIIALSRRDLPSSVVADNPKLKVTIVKDFLAYPESLLQDIQGAEACIWSLGKARMPDNDTARKISIDYTLAAAKAFSQDPANGAAKKFRFVYCSGAAAERDQTKTLWFMQDYRRIRVCFPPVCCLSELWANQAPNKGQVENDLLAYARDRQDRFETCIVRPGMVLGKETSVRNLVVGLGPSVRVDVLAEVMLDVALNGSGDRILKNSAICRGVGVSSRSPAK